MSKNENQSKNSDQKIYVRKSNERGYADHGWLRSYHSFSFADYYDPQFMGFGPLRVINEDFIKAGTGFGTHPHKDMEIITYVISGALRHKDSMGNSEVINAGEVQYMSAGTGVRHSEFSETNKVTGDELTHLLQIWILPNKNDLTPRYAQRSFAEDIKIKNKNKLVLLVSEKATDNSLPVHQDLKLYSCFLESNKIINSKISINRKIWIQLISGAIQIKLGHEQVSLNQGDAAAFMSDENIEIKADENSEFLFFDML